MHAPAVRPLHAGSCWSAWGHHFVSDEGLATLSGYTAAILLQYVLKQESAGESSPHLLQGQICL